MLSASVLLSGCASKAVSMADKDTSGAYDGVWIGEVDGPRAKRETLPGNWYMSCAWEPFEMYITVDNGLVQLGRMEGRTPISGDGRFRLEVGSGPAGMSQGTMPGNAEFTEVFSGTLDDDDARGKFFQYVASRGAAGCSAKIRFTRYRPSNA